MRAAVERSGLAVVWGRSQEQASDGALWPWRQVVQALVRRAGRARPGRSRWLTAGAPAGGELGGVPVDRLQLYDAVARLLAARPRAQPAVIVLEDIHWADADSLRLLDYLATELHDRVGGHRRDVPPGRGRRAGRRRRPSGRWPVGATWCASS